LGSLDARVQLKPGDMIFTGSTCGVGLEDGRFLQPGDVIEAEIEGIGVFVTGLVQNGCWRWGVWR
ncbi:fumarylacetoacetate hydrolase family protein, partial [Glaciimonas sp. GG7]